MLQAVADYAGALNFTSPYWLTLSGKSGVGKTHLAKVLWRQFMEQNRFEVQFDPIRNRVYGNSGTWCNWRKFCDDMRGGDYELLDDLCGEWFVIIDDLGAERDPSGFISSKIDRLMNERLGKWTVITTNLSLAEIASRIDARVASRMLRDGGQVIECTTVDFSLRAT